MTPVRAPSLLDQLTRNSLDAGYAEAAARRAVTAETAAPTSPRIARPGAVAVLALLAAGSLLATAAASVRARAPADARLRDTLGAEVAARTASTDAAATQVAALRTQVAAARSGGLAATRAGEAAAGQLTTLETATGATALRGPGLRVRLDDATSPAADPLAATPPTGPTRTDAGRITDRDVQDVVNALWAAGAEAIAVSGQRLSAQAAIRSAGAAILVNFRPLSPPYGIDAIGDPAGLGARFGDSPTGRRFRTYTTAYGVGFTVHSATSLTVPAATGDTLRAARVLEPTP
jgi:uncharacterized protein YlxW (UPF0749 family)